MSEKEKIERAIYYQNISQTDFDYIYVVANSSRPNSHYCKTLLKVLMNLKWVRND
jgi:hypothetical protein